MNPGPKPSPLEVDRVEWLPSSPDEIEVRVFGAWRGSTVPPVAVLAVAGRRLTAEATPPAGGPPPEWAALFLAPIESRGDLESADAWLELDGEHIVLPAARPGVLDRDPDPDNVVDPGVLAERRARRAEAAEGPAAQRAASAEETAETLRTQLEHLETRLARSTQEREQLAARVADAEQRLRTAEQGAQTVVAAEVEGLRDQLAASEELTGALQRELERARHRRDDAERDATHERERARELELVVAAERSAREAAERRAEASPASRTVERQLREEIGRLERQVHDRTEAQERMKEVVSVVRGELERVRDQVEAAHDASTAEADLAAARAQLAEMEERRSALEDALRARAADLAAIGAELDAARAAADVARREAERNREDLAAAEHAAVEAQRSARDLAARLDEERRLRAEAEADVGRARAEGSAANRRELQARLDEVAQDVVALRGRLREATEELERRLTEERARRLEAETELAALRRSAAPPAPAQPETPAAAAEAEDAGDEALDTLISGLRALVAAARRQLDQWGVEPDTEGVRAPAEEEAEAAAEPAAQPEAPAPAEDASAEQPAPAAGKPAPVDIDERTRVRLQEIEADLRAAVPDPASGRGARDVIADLQRAAERLRETAEEELERLGDEPEADAEPEAPTPPVPATPGATAPLTPRDGIALLDEGPWLRTGLVRLAERDTEQAAHVIEGLLPVQAGAAEGLSYELTALGIGTFRVALAGGAAQVERRPEPGPAAEVDAVVAGPIDAVAPLVAGDAGWRLKGANVRGSRRRVHRLTRARRRPVGLADLARSGVAIDTSLVLAALAASVDPVWTAGHRFAVRYAVAGEGECIVVADDGRALRLDDGVAPAATVLVGRQAVLHLLAGAALPAGESASAEGDRAAVDRLHGWFDRARAGEVR